MDFANAFGSVRHSLIQYALLRYHIPQHIRLLFFNYYDQLFAQVETPSFKTQIFHCGIGVFQGCTASPVLFNLVMQLFLDVFNQDDNLKLAYSIGPLDSKVGKVLCPTFADDLGIVTKTIMGNQILLNKLHTWLMWSQTMRLKVQSVWHWLLVSRRPWILRPLLIHEFIRPSTNGG